MSAHKLTSPARWSYVCSAPKGEHCGISRKIQQRANKRLMRRKKGRRPPATFVVRTSASHLAITDRIDTPYNTKGRSMHPDRNSHPVRGSNNSRGHGRGRRPLFHRSPYQQLLRLRDRHANHPNRPATPELVMMSPRQ